MKTLLELEPGDCRFPFGDRDFTFCAAPQCFNHRNGEFVQSSYCRQHHFICTKEPAPRRATA